MNEYSLQSSPIDGLTLHAQYYDFNAYDDGVTTNDQSEEGGAYAATYALVMLQLVTVNHTKLLQF